MDNTLQFLNITSDHIILPENEYGGLVKSFIEVFTAVGEHEWGESWTWQSADDYLDYSIKKINSLKSLSLLIDKANESNAVAGFCLGHIGEINDIIQAEILPHSIDLAQRKIHRDSILRIVIAEYGANKKYLFFQELAILKKYRHGSKRVAKLIIPVLQKALINDVKYAVYWTSKNSKFYRLSKITRTKTLYRFNDPDQNIFVAVPVKTTLFLIRFQEYLINFMLWIRTPLAR